VKNYILLFICSYFGLYFGSCLAENSSVINRSILDSTLLLPFEPKDACFIVYTSEGIKKIPAVLTILPGVGDRLKGSKQYLVGGSIESSHAVTIQYVVSVNSQEGKNFLSQVYNLPISFAELPTNAEGFRSLVISLRANLSTKKEELDQESMSLKRLRLSAANAAEIGKIIEVEEETKRIKEVSEALRGDIETLQNALNAVKVIPAPHKFEKRKYELNQQLTQMAKAALFAEEGARQRSKDNEMDLDKKLSIVDLTRFEDLDELQREYDLLNGNSNYDQKIEPENPSLVESKSEPKTESSDMLESQDYFNMPE